MTMDGDQSRKQESGLISCASERAGFSRYAGSWLACPLKPAADFSDIASALWLSWLDGLHASMARLAQAGRRLPFSL